MPPPLPNHDIDAACRNAASAFSALSRLDPVARAAILDAIAAALDARRDDILTTCADETALTIDELTPEFARMTGTLRMFASLVREGSWVRAAIDTRATEDGPASSVPAARLTPDHRGRPADLRSTLIGPNHDLRSLLVPLGPVAVFGSSNFPLAYGVCGGDTASALAAGCPVIIKEHPAHPITGRLLAGIAQSAIACALDEPDARARVCAPSATRTHLLQYIENENPTDHSIAQQLVQHPALTAVGFTGSIPGGLAIEKLARERANPIPVFAEMGSVNHVVILPSALRTRGTQIAAEIASSILARNGQQCTKPGLISLPTWQNDVSKQFISVLAGHLDAAQPRRLLSDRIAAEFENRCRRMEGMGHMCKVTNRSDPVKLVDGKACAVPTLFAATDVAEYAAHYDGLIMFAGDQVDWLRDEIFGPAAIVLGEDDGCNTSWADPSLAVSVYADPEDAAESQCSVLSQARLRAGRITFNSPPTGVRVCTSTVHGGPFPATNAPHTTAVGPRAIERWCRPLCFQNCPDVLLPPELQNANPRMLTRTICGRLSAAAITG